MSHRPLYAKVIVPVNVGGVDQTFDYAIGDLWTEGFGVGTLVVVPFRNRILTGCVLSTESESREATREILNVTDKALWLPEDMVNLVQWLANEWLCPLGVALKSVLMGGSGTRRRSVNKTRVYSSLLTPGRRRKDSSGGPQKVGLDVWDYPENPVLTDEQRAAVETLSSGGKHLLFGITGSGKTEVYMKEIQRQLNLDKGSIVLIPEISLTPQTVARFRGRFGSDVALLHSGLSPGERHAEWRRLKSGDAKVAVGARSAVYAPVKDLALIIIDEEHDKAYKQDSDPKYHARRVAEYRAPSVVLGTATPSVESYYRARQGEYRLSTLKKRVGAASLPESTVVDMREELKAGNRTMFSAALTEGIKETLGKKRQVILFINRRGHSTFVMCRECGHVIKCPWCDVSAVYHAPEDRLRCHYCSWSQNAPSVCPECGSRFIRYFGTGTQKVEAEVKARFPESRVLRMDRDTTQRRGSHERILGAFRQGQADILVGTQMVSKGHDIPGVGLVGLVSADITLNLPDFRSAERTFQMVAQVSGRAGRTDAEGRVIIQTYAPEHYSIDHASKLNYEAFYEQELLSRQQFGYPPFGHLLGVNIRGKSADECLATGEEVVECVAASDVGSYVEVLGPAPQAVSRIKRIHRWQIIIKAPTRPMMREAASLLWMRFSGRVSLDLEPENIL